MAYNRALPDTGVAPRAGYRVFPNRRGNISIAKVVVDHMDEESVCDVVDFPSEFSEEIVAGIRKAAECIASKKE